MNSERPLQTATEVATQLDVTPQAIRYLARKHDIGIKVGKKMRRYRSSDIEELRKHVGHRGNPEFTDRFTKWTYDEYLQYAKMDKLTEEGYASTPKQLMSEFDIDEKAVRGLRRRKQMASRLCVHEHGDVKPDQVAEYMHKYTEYELRKLVRGRIKPL